MSGRFSTSIPKTISPKTDSKFVKGLPARLRRYFRGSLFIATVIEGKRTIYRNADSNVVHDGPMEVFSLIDSERAKSSFYHFLPILLSLFLIPISVALGLLFSAIVLLYGIAVHQSRRVTIAYYCESSANKNFFAFCNQFSTLNSSNINWIQFVSSTGNSGRFVVDTGFGTPEGMHSNFCFPCLKADKFSIYFSPDTLIIQSSKKTQVQTNSFLNFSQEVMTINENMFSPVDSESTGHFYKYQNNNGSPDRRYKDNPQFPINKYPAFNFRGGGLHFYLIASNPLGLKKIDPALLQFKLREAFTLNKPASIDPISGESIAKTRASHSTNTMKDTSPDKCEENKLASEIKRHFEKNAPGLTEVRLSDQESLVFRIPALVEDSSHQLESSKSWVQRGVKIKIGDWNINGGWVYFRLPSDNTSHPSLIDKDLPIESGAANYREALEGYYPSYRGLSPDKRASFLSYLASDRSDQSAAIGYVFLYFYGLERRLVLDAGHDISVESERPLLIAEVARLKAIYTGNNSFQGYARRLLEFTAPISAITPNLADSTLEEIFPNPETGIVNSRVSKEDIDKCIALLADQRRAVSVNWAYVWSLQYSDRYEKAIAYYKPLLFKVFSEVFNEKFPEGFNLANSGKPLTRAYRPAAGGLMEVKIPIGKLTDAANAPDNTAIIFELIRKVNDITESYWRIKRKSGTNAFSMDPYLHLPTKLWPAKAVNAIDKLSKLTGKLTSVSEIAKVFDLTKIDKPTMMRVGCRMSEMGMFMQPNILAGAPTPKITDSIVLFKAEPNGHLIEPTTSYFMASVFVELACAVSNADGQTSSEERKHILGVVDSWEILTEFEKQSLYAKVTLLADRPVTFAKLKSAIKNIPPLEVDILVSMLANVASIDGKLDGGELKLLEKIFLALDIPCPPQDYLLPRRTKTSGVATVLTEDIEQASQPNTAVVTLDFEKIAKLQEETHHIATILSGVFDADTASDTSGTEAFQSVASIQTEPVPDQVAFEVFPAITKKQAIFLSVFLGRDGWEKDELRSEASSLGLMLDGTLEVLNEWSLDAFDEALHDGDNYIDIDSEIKAKILESAIAAG